MHPYIPIFRLRFCPYPTLWGWQEHTMSNTGSPLISILWVNAIRATVTDISLHTFRPYPPRPPLLSCAGNQKACDRFDTRRGLLHMATPSELLTGMDRGNNINAKFLSQKLSGGRLCLWCHRSSKSWHCNCGLTIAVQVWWVPMFHYRRI